LGKKSVLLEASRKMLFSEDPPSKEFETWMKSTDENKKLTRPPI
jgi:hypothetical protein